MNPIEIVGGGLAGLSLGLALRREGVDVTLFEAGTYPRHRVCGEFIAGLGPRTLVRLGLSPFLDGAQRHREVAWFTGPRAGAVHQRLPSPAIGISRHTLDARLAEAFTATGGRLKAGARVTDLTPAPGRVLANGRRRHVKSPWIGLKIHAMGLPLASGLEVHLGDGCYVGMSLVEDGRINVCGLFRRRDIRRTGVALIREYLRRTGLAALADRLEEATTDPASFSAVAAVDFDPEVPPHPGVSIGDACAMVPPFTGNGMAMAFQSAETALGPLIAYARGESGWDETQAEIHRALRRRFLLRLRSACALHPFLLKPTRQRWLAALHRARVLPLSPLYRLLH